MTIDLNHITLTVGSHRTRDAGVCLLEAVAWWAEEEHTDAPQCVSPVLAAYGRVLNDLLPDRLRQQLLPLVPAMAGTAEDGLDGARGHLALDWIVRIYAPAWLERAGLSDSAARLRELEPITDRASARAAEPAVEEARMAANVRAAAWEATSGTWAVAGAAGAARAASKAAGAAVMAAGNAVRGAAGVAARDAAEIAAGAAKVARAASGAATWDAAGDDRGTRDALAPTVSELKAGAIDLLQRMIRP